MLKKISTYRAGYRFLAMVLFASSVLSFIGHTCMADAAHAGPVIKKCYCEKAHSGHEGMKEMPGEPCEKKEVLHGGEHHSKTVHDDCCSTEIQSLSAEATARIKAPPLELSPISDVVYIELTTEPRLWFGKRDFRDIGPLRLSILPLRILYAQFLI